MGIPKVFEGYSANTNEIIETYPTNRGLEQYAEMLGFVDKQNFLDSLPNESRLLDIGAGKEGLRRELAVERPDITVFSINPSLAQSEIRSNYGTDKALIAINPELPIEKESFDVVIDQMASVYYAQESDEQTTQNHLFEIIRVLRRGGKAYVGPTFIPPNGDFQGEGRVGKLLENIRNIRWEKREFVAPVIGSNWRSYHITKS